MRADDTLAVRALNHWRAIDDLTYVGLRLLTEPLLSHWSEWERALSWVAALRTSKPRFREVVRFKEIDTTGTVVPRRFLAASPTTAVVEAHAIAALSRHPGFASHPNVFSYRWPGTRRAGRSFSYYLDLYLDRNKRIVDALSQDRSHAVLVADIRDFYPSVSIPRTRQLFETRIGNPDPLPADDMRLAHAAVESYLHASAGASTGLALGPAFSHVLANVAMLPIDEELSRRYGVRYTRYVDDFAIVVPRSTINAEAEFLEGLLRSHGFRLNARKTDDVAGEEWRRWAPTKRNDSLSVLTDFVTRLGVFCSRAGTNVEGLERSLHRAGFRLPLFAFRTQTMYRRWQLSFLRQLGRRPSLVPQFLTDSVESLYAEAQRARLLIQGALDAEGWPSTWPDEGPTLRRWRLSRLRRVLWWSLQLLPVERLFDIEQECAEVSGLAEMALVARAVRTGRIEGLMAMPGAPMSLALTLIRAGGVDPRVDFSVVEPSAATAESALMLTARARGECPSTWIDSLPDPSTQSLLRRVQRQAPSRRQRAAGDCVDEIDSLLLDEAPGLEQRVLDTRASPSELTALDVSYLPQLS